MKRVPLASSALAGALLSLSCHRYDASFNGVLAFRDMILIVSAESKYFERHRRYAELAELGSAENHLIRLDVASGRSQGYVFSVARNGGGYAARAWPTKYGETGHASYYADASKIIRRVWGPQPATAMSPVAERSVKAGDSVASRPGPGTVRHPATGPSLPTCRDRIRGRFDPHVVGWQDGGVNRDQVTRALREHEQELRDAGVVSVSLFGSTARGESDPRDVDLAVRLAENFSEGGFHYFGRLEELEKRLSELLGCKVDVVEEPVRKARFQEEIDRDRALAF